MFKEEISAVPPAGVGRARGPGMISEKRLRLIGLFVLSDCLAILVSYFYSYLFRFYAYIIPVDPARGIPPLRSYVAVFPLFLAVHLGDLLSAGVL